MHLACRQISGWAGSAAFPSFCTKPFAQSSIRNTQRGQTDICGGGWLVVRGRRVVYLTETELRLILGSMLWWEVNVLRLEEKWGYSTVTILHAPVSCVPKSSCDQGWGKRRELQRGFTCFPWAHALHGAGHPPLPTYFFTELVPEVPGSVCASTTHCLSCETTPAWETHLPCARIHCWPPLIHNPQ